jgi:hypothetical protein
MGKRHVSSKISIYDLNMIVALLAQPLVREGKRERAGVQRLVIDSGIQREKKKAAVEAGTGTKLGEIDYRMFCETLLGWG